MTLRNEHTLLPHPGNLSLFHNAWETLYGDKWMHQRMHLNNGDDIWMTAYKSVIWRRSEQWKRILNVLEHGNEGKHILVVRYDDFKCNLSRYFEKLMEFCGVTTSDEMRRYIMEKEQEQKTRKRTHKIRDIESYGLDPDEVQLHFKAVIKRWNFESEWK